MKNDLTCDIVRDLLPSYADGLTSEETNKAVEAHLKGCEQCRKEKEYMMAPMPKEHAPSTEINYLKKIKHSGRRLLVAAILLGVMLLTVTGIYLPTMFSRTESIDNIDWAVYSRGENTIVQFAVPRREIEHIEVSPSEDGLTGDVILKTKGLPLFSSSQYMDVVSMDSDDFTDFKPQRLTLNGTEVLMEDGVWVGRRANDLFPLAADKAADHDQAILDYFCYGINVDPNVIIKSECNTDAAGSVLAIRADVTIPKDTYYTPWSEKNPDETLTEDACYFLALLGDLKEVRFDYTVNGEAHSLSVTEADAAAKLGKDVKSFSASLAQVQALVEQLTPEVAF